MVGGFVVLIFGLASIVFRQRFAERLARHVRWMSRDPITEENVTWYRRAYVGAGAAFVLFGVLRLISGR